MDSERQCPGSAGRLLWSHRPGFGSPSRVNIAVVLTRTPLRGDGLTEVTAVSAKNRPWLESPQLMGFFFDRCLLSTVPRVGECRAVRPPSTTLQLEGPAPPLGPPGRITTAEGHRSSPCRPDQNVHPVRRRSTCGAGSRPHRFSGVAARDWPRGGAGSDWPRERPGDITLRAVFSRGPETWVAAGRVLPVCRRPYAAASSSGRRSGCLCSARWPAGGRSPAPAVPLKEGSSLMRLRPNVGIDGYGFCFEARMCCKCRWG